MKKTTLLSLLILSILPTFAQIVISNEQGVKTFYPDTSKACNPNMIFTIVEIMPEYSTGLKQLEIDLNEKLEINKKIKGTIYVSIYINCNNEAYGFQVLKGINKTTDDKLIKELQELQNWTSGIQRNKKVDCQQNIGFELKKGKITIPIK